MLTDDLPPEIVPALATLGWPLRSLATIVCGPRPTTRTAAFAPPWQMTPTSVSAALAGALAAVPASPRTDPVRQHLAADPRFSVRSAMQGQGAFHKPAAVGLKLQRRNVGGLP